MKSDNAYAMLYLYDSNRDQYKVEFQFSSDAESLKVSLFKNGLFEKENQIPTKLLLDWNQFQIDLVQAVQKLVEKKK